MQGLDLVAQKVLPVLCSKEMIPGWRMVGIVKKIDYETG